ncbi:MAG: hypothetical protein ACP5VR_12540 [Acidimicrobiales bacterium]
MAVEKVLVSLEHEVVEAARKRVGGRGLSGYVSEAVGRQLRRDGLAELLSDLREEQGPVPESYMEEVRRLWPAPDDAAASLPA